jgi:hypothetical protein
MLSGVVEVKARVYVNQLTCGHGTLRHANLLTIV